jgi:hypothetical protein
MAGEVKAAVTTSIRRTYPVAALPAGHVLGGIQPQEKRQELQLQPQYLGAAHTRALQPRIVVGPGQFGGKVGLLDALQPPELIMYLTVSEWERVGKYVFQIATHTRIYTHTQKKNQPEEGGAAKPPRAPPTDLSHLTEKEKEDRHREQSRVHYHLKRKPAALTQIWLEQEMAQMRTYKEAIDTAPFVMVVLSAHINNCHILYANKPVTEKLGHEAAKLLGR